MSTGSVASQPGYFHETAFYGSDDDFLALAVPFLDDGRRAGVPTLVTCAEYNADLLRRNLDGVEGIDFLPIAGENARPAAAIQMYRKLLAGLVAGGAEQIRIIGDVPHPGVGVDWDGWARYEAVVNHAFAEFPLWGLCPYDLRTTPEAVLSDVVRTHPHVATVEGGHHHNDEYQDPASFLDGRQAPSLDPLELTPPVVDLLDPWPHDARRAVADVPTELPLTVVDDLVTAVSEVVSNARCHGVPPVRVRAWSAAGRIVVTVHDGGAGTTDPFAGLLAPQRELGGGGLGLWIAHQLCSAVSLDHTGDGFTVRLVAGHPYVVV